MCVCTRVYLCMSACVGIRLDAKCYFITAFLQELKTPFLLWKSVPWSRFSFALASCPFNIFQVWVREQIGKEKCSKAQSEQCPPLWHSCGRLQNGHSFSFPGSRPSALWLYYSSHQELEPILPPLESGINCVTCFGQRGIIVSNVWARGELALPAARALPPPQEQAHTKPTRNERS